MSYLGKVALGYSCFYVCAHPKVIIETLNDAVFGWKMGTMEAGKHKKIRATDRETITRAFQEAGFQLPPSRSRFGYTRIVDEFWEVLA